MADQSFTITRKNNATEKEGIQYMESLNRGFFFVDKDERRRILELLDEPKNYSRSSDMVLVPRLAGAKLSLEGIETHMDEVTLIELKPAAWAEQASNADYYRGWTLYLYLRPNAPSFQVVFTPRQQQPSPAFNGIVACVTNPGDVVADTIAFPAVPALPDQAEPGVNGNCMWTPPGPGTVTIQARITYDVTFWANGYTESLPDYTWTSEAATFATGELSAVNTNN